MGPDKDELPVGTLGELIGFSVQMQRVYSAIHKVSPYPYAVLIRGERGTGKASAARSIHSLSQRRNKPFISLDCSTLAPTLFEPELFGYAKGAFAGASQTKWGLLALAGEGTLFMGEIAELPLKVQARLLRTLEAGVFNPIGSPSDLPFKARIIAASCRDLQSQVKAGTFREDLYLRLNVMQIDLPPVRERKNDIPLLVDSFIDKYRDSESEIEFSLAAMSYLLAYDWPGNVRELEDAVRHAISAACGPIVGVEDLNLVEGFGFQLLFGG